MKKILIIEDEKALGETYQEYLTTLGYQVKWISGITQLKTVPKDFSADLILLDQGLSAEEMTGIESIPLLKKEFPKVIIVMLSNYSDFLLEDQALEAGAQEYWLKINTSLKDLEKNIKRLVN